MTKLTKIALDALADIAQGCDPDRYSEKTLGDLFYADLLSYGNHEIELTDTGRSALDTHKANREAQRKTRNARQRGRYAVCRSLGLTRTRDGSWE
jgi:hypothetical protein